MTGTPVDYYRYAFSSLNVGGGKLADKAPHKPVLLLTVLQAYEAGLLTTNQIPITPELTSLFKSTWNQLVRTEHTLGFALPFFHLKNEKGNWWELIANPGCESWVQYGKLNTFSSLSMAVACAQIDPKLATLLLHEETRAILQQTILSTYFPQQTVYPIGADDPHLHELKRELLHDSPADYRTKMKHMKTRLDPETYQIDVFSRDTLFRREVVRLYDDTCCITGLRVSAPYAFSMVDACHIVPFHKTFNNHPTNGIALCPNLHRAFDKGAIAVDSEYRVLVSPTFVENEHSAYRLGALVGKPISLPVDSRYRPDPDAFAWHRAHTFNE